MKKLSILIYILLLCSLLPFLSVTADIGPKRSVSIDIIGVNEPYYIDLLTTGSLPNQDDIDDQKAYYAFEDPPIPEILFNLEIEGKVSYILYDMPGFYPQSVDDNLYRYGYMPPSTFKIIIVFEDQHYVTSETITTKLFYSQVVWDLSNVDFNETNTNVGTIKEVIPYGLMTYDLSLRILATIGIEILILFSFGFRHKKSYLIVLAVNAVTQITLTGFLFGMRYFYFPYLGELIVLILGELIILLIEILLYTFLLKEHSKKRAIGYAILANLASFIIGYIAIGLIPALR